jgi:hypothetical protein
LGAIQEGEGVPFALVEHLALVFASELGDEVLVDQREVGHHPEVQECPYPVASLEDQQEASRVS